jgi:hypothetical protein
MILRDKLEGTWHPAYSYNFIITGEQYHLKVVCASILEKPKWFKQLFDQLVEEIDPWVTYEEFRSYLLWESQRYVETPNANNHSSKNPEKAEPTS